MEKIFHRRWWDYSQYRFNYQGRVCLLCSIAFGMLIVLLIECVHPLVAYTLDQIPANLLHHFFTTLFVAYVIDNIYSFLKFSDQIYQLIRIPAVSALHLISVAGSIRLPDWFDNKDDE